jgi:hypothetical protein
MEDELRSLRGAARDLKIPQVPLDQLERIAVSLRQTIEILPLPRKEIVQDPDTASFRE